MGHFPSVISIVGHSGAGKTTLIERLLPLLNASGIRIATIKHSHHAVELDVVGTDSWRHKQAGAQASMLVTLAGMQLIADGVAQQNPQLLAQRYFFDMDLVLVEGFSQTSCAKIEVLRKACNLNLRCAYQDGLVALVTDVENSNMPLPHFGLDDISNIAQFLMGWKQRQGAKI
ncbi:MAG: molybdopterin-guanine dinucleotide biosynthesis protein B [Gallionella sp.]|nr:molybdopterin-guanine dinucleotide biosynthesis protein B [Gallionella sp.]